MLKKTVVGAVGLFLMLFVSTGIADSSEYKLSVFNFVTLNMEASGLGTSVTNSLISVLKNDPSISLLDRKDLEIFLSLNDLQQNDQLDNVVNIGSRLGLDFIVVGSVDKRGSAITVNCSLIQIDKKKEVYSARARAFGDAALTVEVAKLGSLLSAVLSKNSSASAAAASSDGAAIGSPVNIQKIPGNKKIILRWQAAQGHAAAGYEVYRGLNQNGPFAMLGQTDRTEYSDQNVENNITYFYKIRAFDKLSRLSEFTQVLSARTDFAPNSPIILNTEGRAKSILIVWVNNPLKSLDTSSLSGYKVYRAKAESDTYQEIARLSVNDFTGNSDGKMYYRDKALPDGASYFYRLAAYNEKEIESELSNPIKGMTMASIFSVNARSGLIREVKINWASVQSHFVVAYNIYRSFKQDGNFNKIKKIDASEIKDGFVYSDLEGLEDKKQYYYYITAEDDLKMETGPSPVAFAVTRDIPPMPGNFVARNGLVKKVEITWQAAKEEEVEGYNIYWSAEKDGQYNLLKKISGREYNSYMDESRGFDNLGDNKTYYYKLRAYNKVAAESQPALAFATTKPRPQKPVALKGESQKVKEAPLTWQVNPEKDINLYHVYRSTGDRDDFSSVVETDKIQYADKNLKDGTLYRYKIQAKDKDGLLSDFSDIASVTTKPKPVKPEGLSGRYEAGKAELSWSANKESDIDHYIVYEKVFMGTEKISEVKSTSYSDGSIVKGKNKVYVISAVDKTGLESEMSAEFTVSAK
jgi:uncharacterized protein